VPSKTAPDLQHSLVDIPQIDAIADFINNICSEQTQPHPGLGVLWVHRQEIPEGNAPVYALWRAIHGDRRHLAGGTRRSAGIHQLTTEPGPDVSPYHNRQVVVLRPDAWAAWIYLTRPEAELLQPLPPGSLKVETVRQGSDWAKRDRCRMHATAFQLVAEDPPATEARPKIQHFGSGPTGEIEYPRANSANTVKADTVPRSIEKLPDPARAGYDACPRPALWGFDAPSAIEDHYGPR
jgi:hypothetical protein